MSELHYNLSLFVMKRVNSGFFLGDQPDKSYTGLSGNPPTTILRVKMFCCIDYVVGNNISYLI